MLLKQKYERALQGITNDYFYIQELQKSMTRDFDLEISQNGGYGVGERCLLNIILVDFNFIIDLLLINY
ncbi:hypothetical protein [Helicobacter sp. MIT 14-3879]|uniref:hypothetical protein n=1 Tax=Helicobacter sp. MIT 14-3879 TaxID=2040649 RepID=UPI000E1ECEBC|nr:hypothetical protein [Helicobacter sp. MIT 14-3879]RDU60863.1 hypothetical protein CQA44_10115 [Helicobacter sp. MIT 14-3879]